MNEFKEGDEMKLWIMRPIKNHEEVLGQSDPWTPWYDRAFGFVIRAETESEARKIADGSAGDENGKEYLPKTHIHPWLDEKMSTCVELEREGKTELVMYDFHAAYEKEIKS